MVRSYAVAQERFRLEDISQVAEESSQKNHPTVGIISGGAFVEKEVPMEIGSRKAFSHNHFYIEYAGFTTLRGLQQ